MPLQLLASIAKNQIRKKHCGSPWSIKRSADVKENQLNNALARFDLLHATTTTMDVHESDPTRMGL
eukprot:12896730-Prorocentrum_lima.AAC.1